MRLLIFFLTLLALASGTAACKCWKKHHIGEGNDQVLWDTSYHCCGWNGGMGIWWKWGRKDCKVRKRRRPLDFID
jgi:hypothetical protein